MKMKLLIGFSLAVFAIIGSLLFWSHAFPPTPDIGQMIKHAKQVVKEARATKIVYYDPKSNWTVLPKVKQVKDRKALFIAKFLPLIAEQNERIIGQRAVAKTARPGSLRYHALTHAYGLKTDTKRAQLLSRVDAIPISLALAQAALESGWGTSRFAQKGHAYFGERSYNLKTPGMSPKRASGFVVKSFPSTVASIRSFMFALNTHPAYRALRARRAQLRANGKKVNGLDLVPFLRAYSEIGSDYTTRIRTTIRVNKLAEFNGIDHVYTK